MKSFTFPFQGKDPARCRAPVQKQRHLERGAFLCNVTVVVSRIPEVIPRVAADFLCNVTKIRKGESVHGLF
nr:MAG TPA: hypothetical protein [Caudoviricetes sp.]